VREQVQAISNLRIDKITVWDSGAGSDGKSSTASFLSGLAGSVPPLHELAKNVGVELPEYLGKLNERETSTTRTKPGDESI
jgi:flotillin